MNDLIASLQCDFQRFFNNDILASLGSRNYHVQMDTARRTHTDEVEVMALEHFMVV